MRNSPGAEEFLMNSWEAYMQNYYQKKSTVFYTIFKN